MGKKYIKRPTYTNRGRTHDELMAQITRLLNAAGVNGQRRRELYRTAQRLRRVYLDSTGCGVTANRKAYAGVEAQLTLQERQCLKRRLASRRRNAGTYSRRQVLQVAGK